MKKILSFLLLSLLTFLSPLAMEEEKMEDEKEAARPIVPISTMSGEPLPEAKERKIREMLIAKGILTADGRFAERLATEPARTASVPPEEKSRRLRSALKRRYPQFSTLTDSLFQKAAADDFTEKKFEVISYLNAAVAQQEDTLEEVKNFCGFDLSQSQHPLPPNAPEFEKFDASTYTSIYSIYLFKLNNYQQLKSSTLTLQRQVEALKKAQHPLIEIGIQFDILNSHLLPLLENTKIQEYQRLIEGQHHTPMPTFSVDTAITLGILPPTMLLNKSFMHTYAFEDIRNICSNIQRRVLHFDCIKTISSSLFDGQPINMGAPGLLDYMLDLRNGALNNFAPDSTTKKSQELYGFVRPDFHALYAYFKRIKQYDPAFSLTLSKATFYEVCFKRMFYLRGEELTRYVRGVLKLQNAARRYDKDTDLQARLYLREFARLDGRDLDPFFNPHSPMFAFRDVAAAIEDGLSEAEISEQFGSGTLRIHFDEGDLEADGAGGGGGSGGSGASSKKSKKSGGKKGKKGSKKGKKGKKGSSGKKKKGQQKASQSTATSEHAGSESAAEATDASVTVTTTTDIPATHDGAAPAAEAYETSVFSPTKTGKAARKKNAQQLALLRTLRQQAPTMGIDSFAALSRTLNLAPTEFMPLYRHPTTGADQSPEAPSLSPALTWLETQLTTDHQNTFLDILYGRKALLKYADVFNMFSRMPGVSVTEMGGGSSHKRVVLQTAEREKPFFMGHILKPHGRQVFGRNAITYTKGTLERILEKLGLDITHFEKLR